MIVVADTSPINYLVLIDEIDVLPKLLRQIAIPTGVLSELQRDKTPRKVRGWAEANPPWLSVEMVTVTPEIELEKLGRGEYEAIILAEKLQANLLIIDDRAGRKAAVRIGLRTVGTLFVLQRASRRAILDLPQALEKLQRTNFRISPKILQSLLDE